MRANGVVNFHHRPADQLLEPGGYFIHAKRAVSNRIAGRTAQVTDEDQASAAIQYFIQRGQRASNPAIVGNASVRRLGDVEVDTDQDLLTRYLQVANSTFGHDLPLASSAALRPGAPARLESPISTSRAPRSERSQPLDELCGPVRVTPLVVVPADHLDEAVDDQGLIGDEDARVGVTDDVARDQRISGVLEDVP